MTSATPVSDVPPPAAGATSAITAPLAGNVFKIVVAPGQQVGEGETVLILEAMKMETEISAHQTGTVASIDVSEGDAVQVGDTLISLV